MVARFSLDIMPTWVLLKSVYVQPRARKKGIGKLMVKRAIKEALKYDLTFMLKTHQDWRTTWYEGFGFEVVKYKRGTGGYKDQQAGYNWLEYKR